jgi:hydroxymethylpyrimidine/phosphomethylpyrimidine kinase
MCEDSSVITRADEVTESAQGGPESGDGARRRAVHVALTIAGSDSSGGAGIQADLKTFAAHGVYGLSAVTAVTAQNTEGVQAVAFLSPDVVTAQIAVVAGDFRIEATKIGMLAHAAIVEAVAAAIDRYPLGHVVLDPVLTSTAGRPLLDEPGLAAMRSRLLSRVDVITPNVNEAAALVGFSVRTIVDARRAAEQLAAVGARGIVITGGHLAGPAIDLVYEAGSFTELPGERIDSRHTHGTGCTFSAALAARLASGDALVAAARAAKAYVADSIRRAPGLGRGRGPLGHF